MILAIDPGDIFSAFTYFDGNKLGKFDLISNREMRDILKSTDIKTVVIEMVASYGMPVGSTVFETCVNIGRFQEICFSRNIEVKFAYRKDIKMSICGQTRAKDSNVIQALVDRYGDTVNHGRQGKGTKKNHGFFYGFKKDIWQAFAVAVYYTDIK